MCFDVWYLLFTSTLKFIFWSQVFYLIWYCRSIREIFSRWYVNEEWTYMIMFVKWLMQGLQNTQSFIFFSAWWIKITYYEINIQMKQLKIIRQFTLIEKGFEYPWPDLYSLIFPVYYRLEYVCKFLLINNNEYIQGAFNYSVQENICSLF